MSIFKTATPDYEAQPSKSGETPAPTTAPNLCDRVAALFRTPTPTYQPKPDPAGDTGNGDGGDSDSGDSGCGTDKPDQGPVLQQR